MIFVQGDFLFPTFNVVSVDFQVLGAKKLVARLQHADRGRGGGGAVGNDHDVL